MKTTIGTVLLVLALAACGKAEEEKAGGSGSSTGGATAALDSCGTKSLFSVWTDNEGTSVIDYSLSTWGNHTSDVVAKSGATCSLTASYGGNECKGTIKYTSTWNFDGPGDPGCKSLESTQTFTKGPDNILKTCFVSSGSCTEYF
jgi:hypothetical protein